jgi:FMN phosphatase YigB (HAD superfamily)
MIGDNLLTDMAGAANAGIDSVLYNPNLQKHDSPVTHEIHDLLELKQIL